jgi:hypothetical protein
MPALARSVKLRLPLILRHACPACGSEEVGRTHRRTAQDWVLSAIGVKPFRCGECRCKFYAVPALRELAVSSRERRALELRGAERGPQERRMAKQKAKQIA